MARFINKNPLLFYFLSYMGVFSCYLVITWPGLFMYDTFSNYKNAANLRIENWTGLPYTTFMIAVVNTCAHPTFQGVLQSIFATGILLRLISLFGKKYNYALATPLIFLFAWPLHALMILHYTRDFWAGWLYFWLVLEVFHLLSERYYLKRLFPLKTLLLPLILLFLTATIRKEHILLLPLVSLIIVYCCNEKTRLLKVLAGFVALFYVGFPVVTGFKIKEAAFGTPRYQLTTIVNPLSHIINQSNHITEEQKERISRVIPYERFKSHYSPFEIDPMHGYKIKASEDEIEDFFDVYREILTEHPKLFLENRWAMSKRILITSEETVLYTDDYYLLTQEKIMKIRKKFAQVWPKQPLFPRVRFLALHFRYFLENHTPLFNFLFNSLLPHVLLCLVFLTLIFQFPILGVCSGLILLKTPLVLLTAPAPQMKYLYQIQIFGLSLFFLLALEIWYKKKKWRKS